MSPSSHKHAAVRHCDSAAWLLKPIKTRYVIITTRNFIDVLAVVDNNPPDTIFMRLYIGHRARSTGKIVPVCGLDFEMGAS